MSICSWRRVWVTDCSAKACGSGFYLRYDDVTHYLDFHPYTGQYATVYGQHELVRI